MPLSNSIRFCLESLTFIFWFEENAGMKVWFNMILGFISIESPLTFLQVFVVVFKLVNK